MKRSLKNSFMIIMILASLIGTSLQASPAEALGTMEEISLTLPTFTRPQLMDLWGFSADDVYAVGYGTDGAVTKPLIYEKASGWTPLSPGLPGGSWTSGLLEGVWASDATHVYAVGQGKDGDVSKALIYAKGAGGWSSHSPTLTGWVSPYLEDVWGSSAANIFAVGVGTKAGTTEALIIRSTDGAGATWTSVPLGVLPTGVSHGHLASVWGTGTPTQHIYAVGFGLKGTVSTPLIYRSVDSGTNWTAYAPALPTTSWSSGQLYAVWGSGTNDIYAVGSGSKGGATIPLVYHSTNGISWTPSDVTMPSGWNSGELFGVWGSDSGHVYLAGSGVNGTMPLLYRKMTAGFNPLSTEEWNPAHFESIWGSGVNDVYAAGYGTKLTDPKPLLTHAGPDLIAPGAVIGLNATKGATGGTINLSWTAPADDADVYRSGPVDRYKVIYSESALVDCSSGTEAANPPLPVTPGTLQTMTVTGLKPGTLYNFSVCTWDEEDNPIQGVFAPQVSETTPAYGQGIYDDEDSAWSWGGSWSTYGGPGPYASTLHYSKASNATATFKFQGPAKFILTYTADTNRDKILVTVDTGPAIQINAKSTSTRWQQTYTSVMYSDDAIHTVTISSPGTGTYIDVDAIQIMGPPTSGIYDDNHSGWSWGGIWGTYNGPGPYANTLHYSNKNDATATFVFQGPAYFILTYSADTNRDKILVTVDTDPAIEINAKSTSTRWLQTYTSTMYSDNGVHTVTISSPGTGTYIDVDAIQIVGPPPVMMAGKYDDMDPAFSWGGSWGTYNGPGPYVNTLHYSNKSDATATFRFQAPAYFIFTYSADTNRDKILVTVDTDPAIEINANAPSTRWYQTYTSAMYSDNGVHTVTISSPGTGTYIDVDAVQIVAPQPIKGVGKYDDMDPAFSWGGSWSTYSGPGPYADTLHYSKASNATATFVFQGPAKFILTYTADTNRSTLLVSVDGGAPSAINTKSTSTLWYQTYTSAVYGTGSHLVTISSPGTGTYIDVDAIQIVGPPPAMTVGKHDDKDPAFSWGGSWGTYNGAGPYANSLHYSNKSGATATFVFQGPAKFILTYTADTNRDKILVTVDGGTPIEINAKSTGTLWQQTYTSAVYAGTGSHIVTISGPGTGTYIDVDAVQIMGPPPAMTVGKHDDMDPAFSWGGSWGTYNGAGPYANTLHYSNKSNATASFVFQAPARFILTYTADTNRDKILVSVDGGTPIEINAKSTGTLWEQTYISSLYTGTGIRIVTISHPGTATYIDVDAVEIQ